MSANLFYGTGIPACIVVIDKEKHKERDGIFMIDASRDFIKDGNKNRLRERDVYKITTVFNQRIELPKDSRFAPNSEIKAKNGYNLNIPRYIDSGAVEDLQNIDGHLNGGIPNIDVDSLSLYWQTFPKLQASLFKPLRKGFYSLAVEKDVIRDTIYNDVDFSAYAGIVKTAFENWKVQVDKDLRTISGKTKPKLLITEIAEQVLNEYESVKLIDKYDAYEVLLSYWNETMSDDIYLLVQDGYKSIRDIEVFTKTTIKKKKDGTEEKKTTETGWDGKLVPKALVIEMFFSADQKAINDAETAFAEMQVALDELLEIDEDADEASDEGDEKSIKKLQKEVKEKAKIIKGLRANLDRKTREHYVKLTNDQCLELLLERKWYCSLENGINTLYTAVSHRIADRVTELADRYGQTLPVLENEVVELEGKVKSHLERMGFV